MWQWLQEFLAERRVRQERQSPHELKVAIGAAGGSLVLVLLLLAQRWKSRVTPPVRIALSVALQLLRQKKVKELIYSDNGVLMLRTGAAEAAGGYVSLLVPGSEATVFEVADKAMVAVDYAAPKGRTFSQVMSIVVPMIFLFVWYQVAKTLITRENKWTPTRSRRLPREKTTFADVVSRSKVELSEIVEYLNHPAKFKQAGARLPRGALLIGPSGTGKTLLARAVAGEANCNFLSASASEFVEVYVGRGASRVRDLFKQARNMAPVVLFLDELDALGTRSRGLGALSGSEEYVQTLNQLLSELDGFYGQSDGIVILGATNRSEAIDPALLRPGRFDRFIQVDLPDEEERRQILRIHTNKADPNMEVKASTVDSIAAASSGFSGAELANVVNEAVFLALRESRSKPSAQDFSAALERRKVARKASAGASTTCAGDVAGAGFSRAVRIWPKAAAV